MKRIGAWSLGISLLLLCVLMSGCGYTRDDLDAAWEEGYRSGVEDTEEESYCAGYEAAIADVREMLQCEEGESIEENRINSMWFHVEDGYREGYSDAELGIPNLYEVDDDTYWEKYWEVYDKETGELKNP